MVHSLRETDIQALLQQTKPSWKWEPMLLDKEGEEIHIYTGLNLRIRLLLALGPRKTWNVLKVIYQQGTVAHHPNLSRRKIIRWAAPVLGGLAIGLGVSRVMPSAQGATPSMRGQSIHVGNSPYTMTQLTADDPAIAELKQSSILLTASKHFGEPNWNSAFKYEHQKTPETGYIVIYKPSSSISTPQLTFLTIGNPSKNGEEAVGVVAQLTQQAQKQVDYYWFTPEAYPLALLTYHEDGSHSVASVPTTLPDTQVSCFTGCLGSSVSNQCAQFCLECVLFNPIACAVCAVCAGPAGVNCANTCKGLPMADF